jgi:hypothetical protein
MDLVAGVEELDLARRVEDIVLGLRIPKSSILMSDWMEDGRAKNWGIYVEWSPLT